MKKYNRNNIQDKFEKNMLESLNVVNYSVKAMQPSQCKDLADLKNINELLKIDFDSEKLKRMVVLINQKSAEFFKTLIIYKNGKPVAAGCINITQVAINFS